MPESGPSSRTNDRLTAARPKVARRAMLGPPTLAAALAPAVREASMAERRRVPKFPARGEGPLCVALQRLPSSRCAL
jgi:hypothetical protein